MNRRSVKIGRFDRWASLVGGAALAVVGIERRSWAGLGLAALGGGLIYRGGSGHCFVRQALAPAGPARVDLTVTVSRSPEEVYELWRDLENLPRFMRVLDSIRTEGRRSHWVLRGPAGTHLEWDAEIVHEIPGRLIEWRSLEGSSIRSWGSVRFTRKRGGRGSRIHVVFHYQLPAGRLGEAVAGYFGRRPEEEVAREMQHLKAALDRV